MKRKIFILTQVLISIFYTKGNCQKSESQLAIEQEVLVEIPQMKSVSNKINFLIKNGKVKSISNQQGITMNTYYFDSTKALHSITSFESGTNQRHSISENAIEKLNNSYDSITVSYFEQVKNISGFSCKKAIVKFFKTGGNVEEKVVWYYPDVKLSFKYNFGVVGLELINGLPMQYENQQFGIKMNHTVVSIDLSKLIDEKAFEL